MGKLQERYLGDPAGAKASYEAAVRLAPEKAHGAKESVDRLRRDEQRQADRKKSAD